MTFELYHTHHSTCSQKVRIALAEKGLPNKDSHWVAREVDLGKFEHLTPEYLQLNPNGVVPTLIHDGSVLIESSAIVEYLDEVLPQNELVPKTSLERAKLRAWMRYIDEVPTVAVRVPSFANLLAPMRFSDYTDSEFAEHSARLPIRKRFYQRMTQNGFGKEEIEYAKEQINQTCKRIDIAILEKGGPWIMGQQYTLADVLVTPLIDRMSDLGYNYIWVNRYERMGEWFENIKLRPSFGAAFYPGSKISERYPEAFITARKLESERGF